MVSEAVWQVTIVDATLIRYYPDVYDAVLARRSPPQRRLIEGTMAGLRFVRNRMRSEAERDAFICASRRPAAPCQPAVGRAGRAVHLAAGARAGAELAARRPPDVGAEPV